MALGLVWSQLAEEKLEDIFEYYQTTTSVQTAHNLVNGIVNKTLP